MPKVKASVKIENVVASATLNQKKTLRTPTNLSLLTISV